MNPLINSFTKTLQPCGGCGQMPTSVLEAINKGEKVLFLIQVQVEADRSSSIDQKKIEDSCGGKVISVNPVPQRPQTPQSQIAGSRIAGSRIPEHMAITKLPTTTTVQPT